MGAALEAVPLDAGTRIELREFFGQSSAYMVGEKSAVPPAQEELAARWGAQLTLDGVIEEIASGDDGAVVAMAPQFGARPSVFVGLLARMAQTGRGALIRSVVDAVERDPDLGRTLLDFAVGAGGVELVLLLPRLGTDPDLEDSGGHTPLYAVAYECGSGA